MQSTFSDLKDSCQDWSNGLPLLAKRISLEIYSNITIANKMYGSENFHPLAGFNIWIKFKNNLYIKPLHYAIYDLIEFSQNAAL
jgi:hypothetical protein